jgi:ADP-ribosyl-[dinitrogen reductase] hydrolase
VVHAFQAAACAVSGAETASDAVQRAVRVGGDTNTVAAIAGAFGGALFGVSSLPLKWKSEVHGWPGLSYRDLMKYAVLSVNGGKPREANGWPLCGRIEPPTIPVLWACDDDDGVLFGNLKALDEAFPLGDVDVAIALCRIGDAQASLAFPVEKVWLVDRPGKDLALGFLLQDVADRIL